jgi:hypothetical protein
MAIGALNNSGQFDLKSDVRKFRADCKSSELFDKIQVAPLKDNEHPVLNRRVLFRPKSHEGLKRRILTTPTQTGASK